MNETSTAICGCGLACLPMAAATAFTSFRLSTTITIPNPAGRRVRLKPLLAASTSVSPPKPRTRRKNHLRPKILRTLSKPFPTAPLPEIAPVTITEPILPVVPIPPGDVFDGPADEAVEAFHVSEEGIKPVVEQNGNVGIISAKSVFTTCACLVGVLMVQTVIAVWVLGDEGSGKKDGKFDDVGSKGRVLVNRNGGLGLGSDLSNAGYFDMPGVEERINIIKEMAREARERERREALVGGNKDSDITKEIGRQLFKLEKRLNPNRRSSPQSIMSQQGLSENGEDEFSEDEADHDFKEDYTRLMFKKKHRFRSTAVNPRNNAKGFSGLGNRTDSHKASGSDPSGNLREASERKVTNASLNFQNDVGKLEKKMKSGAAQESSEGRRPSSEVASSNEITMSQRSRALETDKNQSLKKEKQGSRMKFDQSASLSKNHARDLKKQPVTNKVESRQSDLETNLWWLRLQYVLVILLRTGSEQEAAGCFVLRVGESPYTVAFEDHGDANNFCYLFESSFEALGNFRADIAPLSTKELHKEVRSHSRKVIVVKKGQLKLYVGQPFAEVEMALRSLVEDEECDMMSSS